MLRPVPATQPLRGLPIAQGEVPANGPLSTANELPSRPLSQSLWTQPPLSGSKREREASPPLPSNAVQVRTALNLHLSHLVLMQALVRTLSVLASVMETDSVPLDSY